MDFTSLLTDDQIAVLGCLSALAVCGMVVAASYRLGSTGRHQMAQPNHSTDAETACAAAGHIGPANKGTVAASDRLAA